MKQTELNQLEMMSRIDHLIDRCDRWPENETVWEPAQRARMFLQQVLPRIRQMRERLQAPLVVAMFGGTGTGKSALVNALLGQEVTTSGHQRPTTTRPQILVHPEIDLDLLQLTIDDCDIHRPRIPLLEDIIIVDCPDPDTSETELESSNLERLRRFLPWSDVLIYTSTQQKYRSANVQHELQDAAAGCRLVFVQTHADRDIDIREDWKDHLNQQYEIPEMFFVDSLRSLQEQQLGQVLNSEMTRLQNFILQQLSASNRGRIRRDNVLDLLQATLTRAVAQLREYQPALRQLSEELTKNSQKLQEQMSHQLQEDLLAARRLWERRLVDAVVHRWGSSPFSWVLRLNHSLATLLGSIGLMRARTTAHLALLGLSQGARYWKQQQQEQEFSSTLSGLNDLHLPESELQEKRLILNGYARQAGLKVKEINSSRPARFKKSGTELQQEFLSDAQQEVDEVVEKLAKRNSKAVTRFLYDMFFLIYPGFLLYRIGKNFFYDSFLLDKEILSADFYLPALVFLLLWCGVFVMMFTRKLRRGLKQEIRELVDRLLKRQLHHDLFPDYRQLNTTAMTQFEQLNELEQECQTLRNLPTGHSQLATIKE